MRTIKLFSWEDFFHGQMDNCRSKELSALYSYMINQSVTSLLWRGSPLLATMMTFLVSAHFSTAEQHPLSPASAFTVLSMFNNVLRYPLFVVPKLAISFMELRLAIQRIEMFLSEPEAERCLMTAIVGRGHSDSFLSSVRVGGEELFEYCGGQMTADNCGSSRLGFSGRAGVDYGWDRSCSSDISVDLSDDHELKSLSADPLLILSELDFMFTAGKLSLIVGPTGSGKSTMLLALLGGR
jgi:ABC-type multidrug transport system fused ATPase/permease subunit